MTGLMVQLDSWRKHFGIPRKEVAARLGVAARMPEHWAAGRFSPPLPAVVDYAGLVQARLVLTGGRRILAEGLDIIPALPRLRRESNVTYAVLGARLGLTITPVAAFETRAGTRRLSTVERYAGGLGLWLQVIPLATPVSPAPECLADDPGTGKTTEEAS